MHGLLQLGTGVWEISIQGLEKLKMRLGKSNLFFNIPSEV